MEKILSEIEARLGKELFEAKTVADVLQVKAKYIGKSGEISELLKSLRDAAPQMRAQLGAKINLVKTDAENAITKTESAIKEKELNEKLLNEKVDVTLNKKSRRLGSLHPLSLDIFKISKILTELGFSQVDGPEIEEDKYNFELLNIPKGHPARDMQDTFYVKAAQFKEHGGEDNAKSILLRTQTSNTQARVLPKLAPPLKVFSPGRVFRIDELDATHAPAFYQIEGLYVDKKVSMADLKKTLLIIMKKLLGEETKIRFRASYFPFTEPSVEVDASCNLCGGKGCPACKNAGWLEMLGAGMVHPVVLENAGIDSTKFSGFAFGIGIDRMAKLNYKVADMRSFYLNDVRFLSQFGGKN